MIFLFGGRFHRLRSLLFVKRDEHQAIFDKMPEYIKRLAAQARREKRLIEREKYAEANGIKPVVRR